MDWDNVSGFFNSELGKQLTNIGSELIKNELKLSGSGSKNNAVIQVQQPIVQTTGVSNMNTMYWIAGGIGAVIVVVILMRR